MKRQFPKKDRRSRYVPPVGHRIIKTAVAVFFCLLIYYLRGYRGQTMPVESAITAIVCMQPYVRESRYSALNRTMGTLIGAFWGLALLLFLYWFPALGERLIVLYLLMATGVLLSLYSTVLLRMPETSALAAIVFLCIVIAFPDIEEPLRQAGNRMLDVFTGTLVALVVNEFRLPRRRNRKMVYFVRVDDLIPDRSSPGLSSVLFRLNYLYNDGARICLMSEHAPAFFLLQLSAVQFRAPLIVMDGAAIYDTTENMFLRWETIDPADADHVRQRLDALGLSYFLYTVHHQKLCIFHHGEITAPEQVIFDRMRRSPYRSYLEGEIYDPSEIVYIKVIAEEEKIRQIEYSLRGVLPRGRLRRICREQTGAPGLSGLYIYPHSATVEQAEKRVMALLHQEDPDLRPIEVKAVETNRPGRDPYRLLSEIERRYEPVWLPWNRKRDIQ